MFKEALQLKESEASCTKVVFNVGIGDNCGRFRGPKGGRIGGWLEQGGKDLLSRRVLRLNPNEEMINAIRKEENRLRNTTTFLTCMDVNNLPTHNFFDKWLNLIWGKKLGIHITFCRMIQQGLFIIF